MNAMIRVKIALFFIFNLLICSKAHAGIVDLNLLYYSESTTATTAAAGTKTFYDFCVGFGVYKGNAIVVGWNYASYSSSQTTGTTAVTYTSTQMGPKFIFFLNKDHNWRIGAAYNITSSANYQNGANTAETWKGTAYAIDMGYQFLLSDTLLFGARLNYSISNYSEKLIGAAYSTTSSSQTFIYPSLGVSYLW